MEIYLGKYVYREKINFQKYQLRIAVIINHFERSLLIVK